MKLKSILSLALLPSLAMAENIWTEKPTDAPALAAMPNLGPIVQTLDQTVVNIQSTVEAKAESKNPKQKRPGPSDPFSSPEDFFERFFGGPGQNRPQAPRRSMGSGFIISKDGYILTNNHVIDGATKIEVRLHTDDSNKSRRSKENVYTATLVGTDPATDVALIKIKPEKELLTVAPLGDSKKLQKGDWVLAFGNPFGLDHTVTIGIVSGTGREISPNENRRFDDFIQTDAAINFGNSGGPLVNLKGEVIGINTAITAEGSGIGFAVPVNLVKELVPQLKDSGAVTRGYLGVMIQDVNDEMKEALGLEAAKGVLVNDIVATGPAAKSELKRGDIVLKVNGQEVNEAKALQQAVARIKPGAAAQLEILRDKKVKTISVKVGSLPGGDVKVKKDSEDSNKADKLGIFVGTAKEGDGIQITDIDESSAAAESGLLPGDIIRKVNGTEIKSVEQYTKLINALKSKASALFDIERGNMKLFIALRVP